MENPDVIFVSYCLIANDPFTHNLPATQGWQVAYEAAAKNDYIILQHLIDGINIHLNIDLGIAAV